MREQARGGTPPADNSADAAETEQRAILFRCMGGGVTAFGPITGRRYDFNGAGAMLAVDERDAPALAMLSQLEPIRRR